MNVLLIQNGAVVNMICADSVARAQQFHPTCICVEQPTNVTVGVGWTTADNLTFAPPPVAPITDWQITKFAMLNRLLPAEIVAINTVRQGTGTPAAEMEALWQGLSTANYVDLSAPTTSAMLDQLVGAGILTTARASAILTTPPAPAERLGGV